jgi:hypothetical protein
MKLYRLYTGCSGEYECDYYRGLFKTTQPMLSFVENYYTEEQYENIIATLTDDGKIFVAGDRFDNEWDNEFMYEIIDTDSLT